MKISEWSVKNSLFVNLLSLFLVAAGIVSLFYLRREAFPNVSFDLVSVETVYYGATPEEVEKLVTFPLEDEIQEVDGIKEMNSFSAENLSYILLELDPDTKNTNKVVQDIRRAVDRADDDIPDDTEDPVVTDIETRDYPIITVSLSGNLSERELQKNAKDLEDCILELDEVAKVTRGGWRDKEIWVEVDPTKMKDFYISFNDVIKALRDKNLTLSAGALKTKDQEFLVRTVGEFSTADEVKKVFLRANDLGNWILIEDVATVKDAFEDVDLYEKTDGTRAINLTVVKREKSDAIDTVQGVERIVEEFKKVAPPELEIALVNDVSYYIKRRLGVLKNNAWIGISLVFLALLVFLSRSSALMTAIGIPIAICTTLALMNLYGFSINLVTMFALIMVLGLIVDDAIVISENVYRYMESGTPPREAAVRGTEEVAKPVISAVLTTVAAFIPLFFMSGIMGKFVRPIPFIVIITLGASLMEALIILPSHMADFVRPKHVEKGLTGDEDNIGNGWFNSFREQYTRFLGTVIKHRYRTIALVVIAFLLVLTLAFVGMKFILFPQGLIEQFYVYFEAPIGTSLEETERRIRPIEDAIRELPKEELENFVTTIGIVQDDPTDPIEKRGSHVGQIRVYLTPEPSRDRSAQEIIDELREKIKGVEGFDKINFAMRRAGPPVGKPVAIRLRGYKLDRLKELSDKFKDFLAALKGVSDIDDDYDPGKRELRVEIDEAEAAKSFLTVRDIAETLRDALEGGVATTIRTTDEEIDVRVKYPEQDIHSSEIDRQFNKLLVRNALDNLVPVREVAKLTRSAGKPILRHLDRRRLLTVTAEVDEKTTSALSVNRKAEKYFDSIKKEYPDITVTYGGEIEKTQESFRDFYRAFALAFFLIFMILAYNFKSLLQPLIVMLAIPFGIIGVVIAFFLHGLPLSFMAVLGIIGLSGVVVNDSIILVDFINNEREKGLSRRKSVIKAGRLRLRPVILTTVTTIFGLAPVAYGIGGSDPFLKPMALALSWGLLFATLLTLIIIPCIYTIIDDIYVGNLRRKRKKNNSKKILIAKSAPT